MLPGTLRKGNTTFVNLRATLDDLDDARRRRPSRRRKKLAPFLRELRPLVADAAPDDQGPAPRSSRRPGADNDLIELLAQGAARSSARRAPAFPQHGRRRCARSTPVLELHPPVHAGPHRLVPRLRPGARPTTTPTATSRASSRSSTPSSSPTTPSGRRAHAAARRPSGSAGIQAGNLTRCPGAADPAAPRTAPAPFRDPAAPSTATRARCRPAHEAPARHHPRCSLRRRRRRVSPSGAGEDDGDDLPGPRDLPATRSRSIPGEDVKIAGVKVGKIDVARRHRRAAGRGRPRRSSEPGFQRLPRGRRRARSARSR